jgi:hypothetical protein
MELHKVNSNKINKKGNWKIQKTISIIYWACQYGLWLIKKYKKLKGREKINRVNF